MSETKELTPMQAVKKDLQAMKAQFKAALPPHISADKFVRVIQTAIANNPDLVNANRATLFSACLKCAEHGVMPDGNEGVIVSYNVKGTPTASFQIMVAGLLKKVRNSGELLSINAQMIYKNDTFDFFVDSEGEHLSHKPELFGDRGEKIGVYAIAKTKAGGTYIEIMNKKDIDSIKKASRSSKYGPWAGDFEDQMWKKTILRRISKRLPMSTDLESAMKIDDHLYSFDDKSQEKQKSEKPKSLKEKMKDVTPEEAKKGEEI